MSHTIKKPSVWIIVLIGIIPQISEAIYSPALPEIAASLRTTIPLTEYTLAIYLFGFACGVFLWGTRSDAIGRRPAVLMGYSLFAVACIGCYFSKSIEALLAWRFVQGLGGAVGSVMGQTIARDSFRGKERGVVFSTVGMVITIGPALGPVIGGVVVQNFHWSLVFIILFLSSLTILFTIFIKLPETHPDFGNRHNRIRWPTVAAKMLTDPQVMTCGFAVGCIIGITFCLYSEGPFYFIDILRISPSQYGSIFLTTCTVAVLGGYISRAMNKKGHTPVDLIQFSILLLMISSFLMTMCTYTGLISVENPRQSIILSVGFLFFTNFAFGMSIPNLLSLSLTKYGHTAGTSGALFGFLYYIITSAITYGMGLFHNGTLTAMPLYFTIIASLSFGVFLFNKKNLEHDHS